MKSNRGFSLVELVIVIAIMAILIGFMAPTLVRYIEKTNVSHDIKIANNVKKAMEIAMSDQDILEAADYVRPVSSEINTCVAAAGTEFSKGVYEILGVSDSAEIMGKLRSRDCSAIMIYVDDTANRVIVEIEGSHADANGGPTPIRVE